MDITVYTRQGGRHWRRCRCPKWLYYTSTWKRVSAKTNSWERAETLAKRLSDELAAGLAASVEPVEEIAADPASADPTLRLEQAVDLYITVQPGETSNAEDRIEVGVFRYKLLCPALC